MKFTAVWRRSCRHCRCLFSLWCCRCVCRLLYTYSTFWMTVLSLWKTRLEATTKIKSKQQHTAQHPNCLTVLLWMMALYIYLIFTCVLALLYTQTVIFLCARRQLNLSNGIFFFRSSWFLWVFVYRLLLWLCIVHRCLILFGGHHVVSLLYIFLNLMLCTSSLSLSFSVSLLLPLTLYCSQAFTLTIYRACRRMNVTQSNFAENSIRLFWMLNCSLFSTLFLLTTSILVY